MNDINLVPEDATSYGFIPEASLGSSETEYRFRNLQLRSTGAEPSSYRRLRPYELETLVKNGNSCSDWNMILVSDPFTPELVKNSHFSGLVRIGKLERICLEHHDLHMMAGITNSRIISCDIGANCAIHDCAYLAHYILGDSCLLLRNDEIHVSNHAKFGNGIIKEGEKEEIRIQLDLMNEAGGRAVLPFDGMLAADAYLWARYRDRPGLLASFQKMATAMFETRLGLYGMIGRGCVLKSNRILKDVLVGDSAYIKGTNKLKNLTINSSEVARTQIGEGVELVNGIIGYGCRVFYGCKAVRFVMCDNSALKYGARLIHSLLGENSTVSCCELLNNLIFPSHEQHHNTSFLIASLVRGQSNMAAGATVGSNHNSRSPDGEIEAGRGFWPGLCVSIKHSSRFASFCLMAKGDYRFELDIRLPFCLIDDDESADRLVVIPAYWWTHNQYALMRNESKFRTRDQRQVKLQSLEFSPFAPDTAEEILVALRLLDLWTGQSAVRRGQESLETDAVRLSEPGEVLDDPALEGLGRSILAGSAGEPGFEVFAQGMEHSDREVLVVKPARARQAYIEMLYWYICTTLLGFWMARGEPEDAYGWLARQLGSKTAAGPTDEAWENLGGQLVPQWRLDALLARAERGEIGTWKEMHAEYAILSSLYPEDKARHAWRLAAAIEELEGPVEAATASAMPLDSVLGGRAGERRDRIPSPSRLAELLAAFPGLTLKIEEGVFLSRQKDYRNPFRQATFRSPAEMRAVLGTAEENSFVRSTRAAMEKARADMDRMKAKLISTQTMDL